MKFTPRQPESNVNVSPTNPLKEFVILAGGLLAIVVGVYLVLGLAVDLIVPRISPDLEKKLAAPLMRQFDKEEQIEPSTRALQALVDRLQAKCAPLPYPVTVHVLDSRQINAAALPGGHMIVFSGLLAEMDSENALAFVLGHELGHFVNRDHLRGLGRGLVLLAASTLLMGADNNVSSMIGQGVVLTEMSFSRKQENRADEFGLEALYCLYGHVAGATDFFERMPKDKDPGRFGHYFASHPENRRRIDHLKELIQQRGYPAGERIPLPADLVLPAE